MERQPDTGIGMVTPLGQFVLLEPAGGRESADGLWLPPAVGVYNPLFRVLKCNADATEDGIEEGDLVYAEKAYFGDKALPRYIFMHSKDIIARVEYNA